MSEGKNAEIKTQAKSMRKAKKRNLMTARFSEMTFLIKINLVTNLNI